MAILKNKISYKRQRANRLWSFMHRAALHKSPFTLAKLSAARRLRTKKITLAKYS